MHLLKAISIDAAVKGFVIFMFYGILTTIYINIAYDLDADLPDAVTATLSGPISIYTFSWLALVGLLGLAATTKAGAIECDFEKKRPLGVFYFSLPICEAAIALGIVIGATLLGVALAAHMLYLVDFTKVSIYQDFYALATFMFFITFPVAYFSIIFLDHQKHMERILNTLAVLYLIATIAALSFGLELKEVIQIGVVMSMLMVIQFAVRKFKP
jgi:hypothetical protein